MDQLLSGIVSLYNSTDSRVLENVIETFGILVKRDDSTAYTERTLSLKKAIKVLVSETREFGEDGCARGLCVPKGWHPFLVILREALLQGGVEIKEVSGAREGQILILIKHALSPHFCLNLLFKQ